MSILTIEDDRSRVLVQPGLGAGIARFDALTRGGPKPVLRPSVPGVTHPFALGCNVLAPFSNRISGGGFTFDGVFHSVEPNLVDADPHPLHGDALLKPWAVMHHQPAAATLVLEEGRIGPWRYRGEIEWRLEDGALHGRLTMINKGPRLPFGGGFHPWFPRMATTQLAFSAHQVWLSDDANLPTHAVPAAERPDWDFTNSHALPDDLIDNCFAGWNGHAEIEQPDLGIGVIVAADSALDHAMVFSLGDRADFFCFEPVCHAIDAINQSGHPGMPVLGTDEKLSLSMTINWRER